MFSGIEALVRHMMHKHGVARREAAPDGHLAALPPPVIGNAEVDDVVADTWHAIVFRHRIRPIQDLINIRCWNGELQQYGPGGADNGVWQGLQTALQLQNKWRAALLPRILKQRLSV